MSKFASQVQPQPAGPVQTSDVRTLTFEGGAALELDAKGALFTAAVTSFIEPTFYERDRSARLVELVHQCVLEDAGWVARLARFTRHEMNMRSVSVLIACEYARTFDDLRRAGQDWGGSPHPSVRSVIDSVCARADEPAEVIGYWRSRYGRSLPMAVKRGVSDAARRLYSVRNVLKYDGKIQTIRFADVLEIAHVKPTSDEQSALFKFLIDDRKGRPVTDERVRVPREILAVREWELRQLAGAPLEAPPELVSWERLSNTRKMDAAAWELAIPDMGVFALIRNLRNFDEAGIGQDAVRAVTEKLTSLEEVRRSRAFPFRFYAAYKNAPKQRWAAPLEEALRLSLSNVPEVPGRTLVLADVSRSMFQPLSTGARAQRNRHAPGGESIMLWEVAGVFAAGLAAACEHVDLVAFAAQSGAISCSRASDVLTLVNALRRASNNLGGGTYLWSALEAHYSGHDRVVIFTDLQAHDSAGRPRGSGSRYGTETPHDAPTREYGDIPLIYAFDLAGYGVSGMDLSNKGRYQLAGFSDAAFRVMPLLEAQRRADWPF